MLQHVFIEGYRGIRAIQLEHLRRVNLLVGESNSGKTSVLEAMQLLRAEDALTSLYQVIYMRDNPSGELCTRTKRGLTDLFKYAFHSWTYPIIELHGVDDQMGDIRVGMRLATPESELEEPLEDGEPVPEVMTGEYYYFTPQKEQRLEFDLSESRKVRKNAKTLFQMEYVTPYTMHWQRLDVHELRTQDKQKLVEVLQAYDSQIIGIEQAEYAAGMTTFLQMKHRPPAPLSMFGDGIKRTMTLANAVARTQGGVLLIDELDTGMDHRVLAPLIEWLYLVAEQYDVQLFLTVHDEAALRVFLDCEKSRETLRVFRMENFKASAIPFDADDSGETAETAL